MNLVESFILSRKDAPISTLRVRERVFVVDRLVLFDFMNRTYEIKYFFPSSEKKMVIMSC